MQNLKIFVFIPVLLLHGCSAKMDVEVADFEQVVSFPGYKKAEGFSEYWYSGLAEVNSYKLTQARYGEMRTGHAVLVFVTEDFLLKEQVKKERRSNKKAVSVLKTNYLKKFTTGIYDYAMMTSVFSPVERGQYPNTLKLTLSSQDWCGQSFLQLNHRDKSYRFQGFSYFEAEGDTAYNLEAYLLEEELFNLVRQNPEAIPTGKVKLIPSTQFIRLRHHGLKPYDATIGVANDGDYTLLSVKYEKLKRQLNITYTTAFPYKIVKWEETYPSGFGDNAKPMTTTAELMESVRTDYWNKNALSDSTWRTKLGLDVVLD